MTRPRKVLVDPRPAPPLSGKGKRTWYPGKVQQAVTTNHTQDVLDSLEAAHQLADEASKSDLMEHAWRRMVGLPVAEGLDQLLASIISR